MSERTPYDAATPEEWARLMRRGVEDALKTDIVLSRRAVLLALDRLDALLADRPQGRLL